MTAVLLGLGGLAALALVPGLMNARGAPEARVKAASIAWAGILVLCVLAGLLASDAVVLGLLAPGLIGVDLIRLVSCNASNVIRHMRHHERDLAAAPRSVEGDVAIRELVDAAAAHGFVLAPGGLTEAAADHGESALLVDGCGRAMEIIAGPLGHTLAVVTLTADERLLYSGNHEIDPAQLGPTCASQGLPGATLGKLVAAHLELESNAREDGVAFVAIPADDAVQLSRESDLRIVRNWLRQPWRNSVGSLARGGPRTLLGLRPRSQPGGAAPTSPSPTRG